MTNAVKTKEEAVTEEKKVLSLDDIAQLGYLTKTKEIFEGVTVTFQTLSHARQQKILSSLPTDDSDHLVRYTQLQVETLVHSTVNINGTSYTEKDADFLRDWYLKLQNKVLLSFYSAYLELSEEQDAVLETLKKK